MSVSPINSTSTAGFAAMMANRPDGFATKVSSSSDPASTGREPSAVKKAAGQFEAIILRQLLSPAIAPIMAGGLGGGEDSGAGIYGYMLTDALANNLASGGGMGLAGMLEKQLTPRASKADTQENGPTIASSSQLYPLKKS